LEGQFEGVQVLGVEDGREGAAVYGAVGIHGLACNPFSIRHLLYQHYTIVRHG
jgi:hypothetical protein